MNEASEKSPNITPCTPLVLNNWFKQIQKERFKVSMGQSADLLLQNILIRFDTLPSDGSFDDKTREALELFWNDAMELTQEHEISLVRANVYESCRRLSLLVPENDSRISDQYQPLIANHSLIVINEVPLEIFLPFSYTMIGSGTVLQLHRILNEQGDALQIKYNHHETKFPTRFFPRGGILVKRKIFDNPRKSDDLGDGDVFTVTR